MVIVGVFVVVGGMVGLFDMVRRINVDVVLEIEWRSLCIFGVLCVCLVLRC